MTSVTSRLRAAVHERLARFLEWIDAPMTIVEPDVLRPENVARLHERLDREVPPLVEKIVAREGADVSQASADGVRAIRGTARMAGRQVPRGSRSGRGGRRRAAGIALRSVTPIAED